MYNYGKLEAVFTANADRERAHTLTDSLVFRGEKDSPGAANLSTWLIGHSQVWPSVQKQESWQPVALNCSSV